MRRFSVGMRASWSQQRSRNRLLSINSLLSLRDPTPARESLSSARASDSDSTRVLPRSLFLVKTRVGSRRGVDWVGGTAPPNDEWPQRWGRVPPLLLSADPARTAARLLSTRGGSRRVRPRPAIAAQGTGATPTAPCRTRGDASSTAARRSRGDRSRRATAAPGAPE